MPKRQSKISIESLEPLIEELTKDKPNTTKVKKMMMDQGLCYTNDPIQQMSLVLSAMTGLSSQICRKKSTEMAGI